ESARLRYQPSMLYITSATLHSDGGKVAVTGEIDPEHSADVQVALSDFDIAPLLTPDWRARFSGQVNTEAKVRATLGEQAAPAIKVEGTAQFQNAQLMALPVLDQIALFTQTQRFRRINLTRLSLDYTQDSGGF